MKPFLPLVAFCLTLQAQAEVRLPALFSDHMVLQQDTPVPVWGWAGAGEKVEVSIAGQTQDTTAGSDGKWQVKLTPLKSAQPLEMTVKGANTITVKDVLVGETWLCSGQSNMVMTVANSKDYEKERATATLPMIRMFTVASGRSKEIKDDCVGSWVVCSPDTVGAYSAVAFYFGRELQQHRGCSVGIINSSAGGTLIESWLNEDAQRASAALKPFFEQRERLMREFDRDAAEVTHQKSMSKWKLAADAAKAAGQPEPKLPSHPRSSFLGAMDVGGLFNGMIAPLIPYAVRGIAWYQGESNAHPDRTRFYETQLRLLVRDMRQRWGAELPFVWVQMPNLNKKMPWAEIREAQLKCLDLPNTGMAITIDAGESKDTHPKDKQTVGHRLAQWALGHVYGEKVPSISGPLPAGHEIRGSELVVRFHHADGGLVSKDGELKGFLMAGENRAWKPATARIEGDTVVVTSPQVSKPVAVRYAWASDPLCNLFNAAGLPASPFRTDDWQSP